MIHEINLKSYQAVCDSPNNLLDLGTSGSYGIEQLHVTADSAWDGLVLTAVFTNGASTEVPVVSGVADVPPEATAYPTHAGRRFGRIVFKGCDADGAVRLISNALLYTIADSGEIDGENTIAPTPDQYAQFVAEVTAEADRAEAAANRAEAAGSTVTPEQIAAAVNNYLTENPVQATPIDATLTQSGQAADAKAVGDAISNIELTPGPAGADGTNGKSAYQYAQDGGYTGTETEFAAKLAQEKFANPNALTFTGAVTGSYDGSAAVTVEIPSGGGGGITGFRRVVDTTLTEAAEIVNLTTDINGNTFSLSECYLFIEAACTEPDTITYIPNGYWTAGTYMISGSKTATDYPYIYIAYSCGGSDHFFGFELRHRTGVSMPNYNSNKSANWRPITSYKLAGKFAKGARFIIFGRDA